MKIIFAGRIPEVPISPTAIHLALSHLVEHKAHATRYLTMSPESRMLVVVVLIVVVMIMMMMYILG